MTQLLGVALRGTGSCLPARVVPNDEFTEVLNLDTSDEWIRTRTGIRERRFAGVGETSAHALCPDNRVARLEWSGHQENIPLHTWSGGMLSRPFLGKGGAWSQEGPRKHATPGVAKPTPPTKNSWKLF